MTHPKPLNDPHRLDALVSYAILDTAPEPEFERAVDVARTLFQAPIALVSLIDRNRQWFKARRGLEMVEGPREDAFCGHAIMDDDVMVVTDAAADPRFADNPLVVGAPHIRFYAGAPLITPSGFRLGTLCVIDTEPRPYPDEDRLHALQCLARMVMESIVRRHKLAETTEGAGSEGDVAARAKHEFLALMSHELRTPLNAVLGFGELIDTMASDEVCRDYAREICGSARHLLSLIERILTFGQVDRGELELQEETVRPQAAAQRAVAALSGLAALKSAAMAVHTPPDLPTVKADPLQLHQMLLNLGTNALQAGAREVSVMVKVARGGELIFTVEDDGIGMDDRARATTLNAFAIDEPIYSRSKQGVGLGLPITRRLVELHGGSLGLRARPDASGMVAEICFPAWRLEK